VTSDKKKKTKYAVAGGIPLPAVVSGVSQAEYRQVLPSERIESHSEGQCSESSDIARFENCS
jgi:hypothetical protein